MKIACVSDLHGFLPKIEKSDHLIVAGDICPNKYGKKDLILERDFQKTWMDTVFYPWLIAQPCKTYSCVFGNHDFVGEEYKFPYIMEHETQILSNGIRIWGTPWSLRFYNWAFNCQEEDLERFAQTIEPNTDIIISHGPAYQYGDKTLTHDNPGSKTMVKVMDIVKPKLFVSGHIHESRGIYQYKDTLIVNASIQDRTYSPRNLPIYVEI